ncbi:hypothetical protein BDF20DRAFT_903490 [Mycotypha africana]|uniref:uncharacterized protein n=1 Tax=Mycotypha africana TaxID=64632 RepID=UPI002300A7A7|nr:uncharacterized protein BDF20DRAFT_903490 [Mycotypha africana]KAI8966967.1 hypothetical protein BDF20DRAFT_903490 [Mycotypha africana]
MSPTKTAKKVNNTKTTQKVLSKNQPKPQQEEEEEEELCFICTEPITIYAVSSCDHRTCHKCALRLRALYETKNCAYCKSEQSVVIFTKDAHKAFDSYDQERDTPFFNKKLNIKFETQSMYKEAMHMMDYNCPIQRLEEGNKASCQQVCQNWNELKQHVIKEHQMNLCDLCTRFKKIFPFEHTLYTPSQLLTHYKEGDKSFLPEDETGFSGHPECGFCKKRYFSDDELFIHCRDSHEQCFLCVKMHGRRHEYYANYDELEQHFRTEHHLCLYKSCLEKKFVVFGTDIDLKAHEVEVHGGSRQLDLNLFQYDSVRNQRHGGKGKGKAKATISDQEVSSSSGRGSPRSFEVRDIRPQGSGNSSNIVSNRSTEEFPAINNKEKKVEKPRVVPGASGLKKSKGKGKAIQKPAGFGALSSDPQPVDFDRNPTYDDTLSLSSTSSSPSSAASSAADNLTVAQHQAFLSKVGVMLQTKAKVAEFKSLTKAYRNSSMSCEDYVQQIILLTNQNVEHTAKILKGVENLMDKEEKKAEIVRVWRNKQTAMSHFPALEVKDKPLASISKPPSRVLVIKGPTNRQTRKAIVGASSSGSNKNKSSSSSHQQTNMWGKVATAANRANGVYSNTSSARTSPQSSRSTSPLPSIPSYAAFSSALMTPTSPSTAASNNNYNGSFPTLNNPSTSSTASPTSTNTKMSAPKPTNTAAFPALPAASKTKHEIVMNMRNNRLGQNAWDPSGANNVKQDSDPGTSDSNNGNTKRKKGRKNNVLFRVGL